MYHNADCMIGWNNIMTQEEFDLSQLARAEKKQPMTGCENSWQSEGHLGESKDITEVEEKILKFEKKVGCMGYEYDHEASLARDDKDRETSFHIYTQEAVPKREYCLAQDLATNKLTATHSVGDTTWGMNLDGFLKSTEGLRSDGSVIGQDNRSESIKYTRFKIVEKICKGIGYKFAGWTNHTSETEDIDFLDYINDVGDLFVLETDKIRNVLKLSYRSCVGIKLEPVDITDFLYSGEWVL